MNGLVALALMAFFALCSQCAATLAAIRRETHGWKWPVFTFTYMTVVAWVVAVGIYQIGSLLGYGLPR
jgi:ferrous iron transport protein B